jgi:glycine cleavage system H protein
MDDRLFSLDQIWVSACGDTLKLGITDYAQGKLGNIIFVNLPEAGDTLTTGEKFADIESIKAVSDLYSPVDGEVVRVNEELADEPEKLNEDPYSCWLIEVRPSAEPSGLVDEQTYLLRKKD